MHESRTSWKAFLLKIVGTLTALGVAGIITWIIITGQRVTAVEVMAEKNTEDVGEVKKDIREIRNDQRIIREQQTETLRELRRIGRGG